MPTSQALAETYGRDAKDRRVEAREATVTGARAALECFYHAFNQRSREMLRAVWAPDALASLNNPLGGITRGIDAIDALYARVFEGPARVWVELQDIVEYATDDTVIFAGRERGEFSRDGVVIPLAIRTSRVFQYFGSPVGWRQIHHHGSIDDADALAAYQRAVMAVSA